jgi:hypothetical protein
MFRTRVRTVRGADTSRAASVLSEPDVIKLPEPTDAALMQFVYDQWLKANKPPEGAEAQWREEAKNFVTKVGAHMEKIADAAKGGASGVAAVLAKVELSDKSTAEEAVALAGTQNPEWESSARRLLGEVAAAAERKEEYYFTSASYSDKQLKIAKILASSNVLRLECDGLACRARLHHRSMLKAAKEAAAVAPKLPHPQPQAQQQPRSA